ncbi:RNA polymerase sigma factor SigJ [Falsiphaeobacter marinintestinus]|uniref:RNA polymerase sigma factor SigJ n=1 Tax=Falsiphaeobacter marinintestinus TaxID=1492905 RepID=UPI0011B3AAE0|nr:RNA polymerase sigma factor SigJ [Phaeobacter marinintestinus]
MTDKTALFESQRPALTALCYRMLGEVAAAEDAVQDTWLRWSQTSADTVHNPHSWLRKVATNIAIDALRSARARRETYVGPWLPEPLLQSDITAESPFVMAQECELALLWAMERLTETERAAFILREAFDAGYAEIAETLGRSEAACRQLVSRAHKHLQAAGPRYDAPPQDVAALIARFSAAIAAQDHAETLSIMAPDAIAISDGGATVRAARRPLIGPLEILHVYSSVLQRKSKPDLTPTFVVANAQPALALSRNGRLTNLLTLALDDAGLIRWVYTMRNPEKLTPHRFATIVE